MHPSIIPHSALPPAAPPCYLLLLAPPPSVVRAAAAAGITACACCTATARPSVPNGRRRRPRQSSQHEASGKEKMIGSHIAGGVPPQPATARSAALANAAPLAAARACACAAAAPVACLPGLLLAPALPATAGSGRAQQRLSSVVKICHACCELSHARPLVCGSRRAREQRLCAGPSLLTATARAAPPLPPHPPEERNTGARSANEITSSVATPARYAQRTLSPTGCVGTHGQWRETGRTASRRNGCGAGGGCPSSYAGYTFTSVSSRQPAVPWEQHTAVPVSPSSGIAAQQHTTLGWAHNPTGNRRGRSPLAGRGSARTPRLPQAAPPTAPACPARVGTRAHYFRRPAPLSHTNTRRKESGLPPLLRCLLCPCAPLASGAKPAGAAAAA